MNTFNDNLNVTIEGTLMALTAQQLQLQSVQTSAQYSLYYAQGAQITAQDKLAESTGEAAAAWLVDLQGIDNDNLAGNLLATATETATNVATCVTNASTAANDVQVAANAISKLTADIGAAFNLVSAADFGTDIYRLTRDANELIQTTAYNAEKVSEMAMEASTATAEIIAKVVQTDATTAKTEVENLLATTQSQFDKLSATVAADSAKVAQTSQAERVAEGLLADANCELQGIAKAYHLSNQHLNLALTVSAVEDFINGTFQCSFNAYAQPFGPETMASGTVVAEAVSGYYITLVKAEKQTVFNLAQAEMDFVEKKDQHFQSVTAGIDNIVVMAQLQDSDGDPIVAGQPYVAFIYLELSFDYKKLLNNFADMISAPTPNFTLTDTLPVPVAADITPVFKQPDNDTTDKKTATKPTVKSTISQSTTSKATPPTSIASLTFNIATTVEAGTEFRCFFMPVNLPGEDVFVTNPALLVDDGTAANSATGSKTKKTATAATGTNSHLGFYFNESIAQQVTAANYTLATIVTKGVTNGVTSINKNTTSAAKGNNSGATPTVYQVVLTPETTDNFGNEIIPGQSYFIAVLVMMNEDVPYAAQYTPALSELKSLPPLVVNAQSAALSLAAQHSQSQTKSQPKS